MSQQPGKKDRDNIERLKRALTRILAIYYSGSSDGNPWGAFCQYLDDFETKHDCPRLWVVEETNGKDGKKRCVLGEGLLSINDGPLAELSHNKKGFPILSINGNKYKVIWSCFEKHTSCDNCKYLKEFIKLLQKECFKTSKVKNKELGELRDCFTKLLDEETQKSIEEDHNSDTTLPESSITIPGNLRDAFFDSLRKEFSGEFAALGLGPNASSTWDGEKSRVVFQIYNPFYRAFFYRNIIYLTQNNIQDEILKKLKKYLNDKNIKDKKIFERVPEPLWMLSEVPMPHKHYLIGLAYHTRQMIFKAITNDYEKAGGLLGKIGDLESVLAWFGPPLTPSRLHVMPLYCYGQPRGVCAIIQAADTDQGSRIEHDGRAHQLQEVLSARISKRIEEEYEREYWEKVLDNTDNGPGNFIYECVRHSPYLLNVVAAAIYNEEITIKPSNLFGFKKLYPKPNSAESLNVLCDEIKEYGFNELSEGDGNYKKINELFNRYLTSVASPPNRGRGTQSGFAGEGSFNFIEVENLIENLRMVKGTLLIKNYQENHNNYRLCFLIDSPINAMRFHAKSINNKFEKLKELYNAFATKIEKKRQEEKLQDLSHLEGVEPKLKEIINTVNILRDQALEVQGKLFPGSMGLMDYRSELAPLFRDEGVLCFWVEENGLPSDKFNLWNVAEYIKSESYNKKQQVTSLNLQIRFGLNPPENARYFQVKPLHDKRTSDEKFYHTWYLYIPFFYSFSHRNNISLLKDIAEASCLEENTWNSPFSEEIKKKLAKEKGLFDLLKEILHRPYNPHVNKESRESILSVGQILAVALEAKKNRTEEFNVKLIIKCDSTDKTFEITSASELRDLPSLSGLEYNLIWYSGPLLVKRRPVLFLSPLYRLLAIELGLKKDKRCFAYSFELILKLDSTSELDICEIKIACDSSLLKEQMREDKEAEDSGLSGSIKKIANCLEQTWPQFIEKKPYIENSNRIYPFRVYNFYSEDDEGYREAKSVIAISFFRLGKAEQ